MAPIAGTIADTLGGEVPKLARRAMLELIAVGHEQSVGEELMTAICTLMEEKEFVVHPKVRQIALPRLVGLVNGVEEGPGRRNGAVSAATAVGSASSSRASASGPNSVRDPVYNASVAKGYDIHELVKVSRRYRADGTEDEARRTQSQAPPETASTASTPSTGTSNALEKQGKTDGKNVDADL